MTKNIKKKNVCKRKGYRGSWKAPIAKNPYMLIVHMDMQLVPFLCNTLNEAYDKLRSLNNELETNFQAEIFEVLKATFIDGGKDGE